MGAGRLGADTLGVIGARSAAKYADASVSAAGVAAELMAEGLKIKTAAHPKGHVAGKEGSAKPAGAGNGQSAGTGVKAARRGSSAGEPVKRHVSARDVAAGNGFPLENLTRTQVKVLRTHAQEAAAMVNFRTDLLEMAGRNPKTFHPKEAEYLADETAFYHMKNPGMTKRMAMQLLAKSEDPRIQKLLTLIRNERYRLG